MTWLIPYGMQAFDAGLMTRYAVIEVRMNVKWDEIGCVIDLTKKCNSWTYQSTKLPAYPP